MCLTNKHKKYLVILYFCLENIENTSIINHFYLIIHYENCCIPANRKRAANSKIGKGKYVSESFMFLCHLAQLYLYLDVTPAWVDVNDSGNYCRTQQNNVSGDPRVSISLLGDENSYRMITIKGVFLFLSDERV